MTADRGQKIKEFIEKHGQVKVSDLTEVIELSQGRVRDLLRKMVSDGTLEKMGITVIPTIHFTPPGVILNDICTLTYKNS